MAMISSPPLLSTVSDQTSSASPDEFGSNYGADVQNGSCSIENVFIIQAEFAHKYLYSSYDAVMATILMPTFICLGCLLNGSFLYVVARIKSMHTTTNFYLATMAVCDMLYLLSTSYEVRAYIISGGVARNTLRDGQISCIILMFENLFYLASMAFVTLVTMERFFAVCYPMKSLVYNRRGRTVKLSVAAWAIVLLVAFVYTMRHFYVEEICFIWPDGESFADLPSMIGWCSGSIIQGGDKTFRLVIRGCKTVTFLTLFAFCSYMCVRIVAALRNRPVPSSAKAGGKNDASGRQAEKVLRQVTRMLLVNTTVFFVCNIPSCVVHICRIHGEVAGFVAGFKAASDDTITKIAQTAIVCTLVNSAINPIIYNVCNRRYRAAFGQAFPALCLPRRRDRGRQEMLHQAVRSVSASVKPQNATTDTPI